MKSVEKGITRRYHNGNGWVLIPAYNESGMIGEVVSAVRNEGYRVLVVDDGSSDLTGEIAQATGAKVLRHIVNFGQGAALETGMTYLRTHETEWVIHFDADGQHDATQISAFLSALEEADVILGSRFLPGSQHPGMGNGRKWLLRMARTFQNLLTGVTLSDAHCGFRALNQKALSMVRLREAGMAHATEVIMEIRNHQLTVREIPVRVIYSDYSQAKGQSGANAFRILLHLIQRKIL